MRNSFQKKQLVINTSWHQKKGLYYDALAVIKVLNNTLDLMVSPFDTPLPKYKKIKSLAKNLGGLLASEGNHLNVFNNISFRNNRNNSSKIRMLKQSDLGQELSTGDILFILAGVSPEVFAQLNLLKKNGIQLIMMINHEWLGEREIKSLPLMDTVIIKSNIAEEMISKYVDKNKIIRVPWSVINFKDLNSNKNIVGKKIRFFHGAGMGGFEYFGQRRKCTDLIIAALSSINGDYELVLTTQLDIKNYKLYHLTKKNKNIRIISRNLNRIEYIKLLCSCNVAIYPSKVEGYGLSIFESIAAGMPVITTDASPMNELVKHNVTGICIPAIIEGYVRGAPIYKLKSEDISKAIQYYINNPSLIKKQSINCLEFSREINNNFIIRIPEILK